MILLIGLLRFLQAYFVSHQLTVEAYSSLLCAKIHSVKNRNMPDV